MRPTEAYHAGWMPTEAYRIGTPQRCQEKPNHYIVHTAALLHAVQPAFGWSCSCGRSCAAGASPPPCWGKASASAVAAWLPLASLTATAKAVQCNGTVAAVPSKWHKQGASGHGMKHAKASPMCKTPCPQAPRKCLLSRPKHACLCIAASNNANQTMMVGIQILLTAGLCLSWLPLHGPLCFCLAAWLPGSLAAWLLLPACSFFCPAP